ncbi:MAG: hypothetical protein FJX53_07360 [Alphaproteobacteria bacterium]|nr:hypothetical protein [Alphaproteobacteria bacterium]
MTTLPQAQRDRLRATVEAAEAKTTGEFVCVLAKQADGYRTIATLVAAVGALLLGGLFVAIPHGVAVSAVTLFKGQAALFVVLAALIHWTPLRLMVVPRSVRHARAHLLVRKAFLDLGLADTPKRNAVLLFVSLGESYVEIMADSGLQRHLDNAVWEKIVANFVAAVKVGRVVEGFEAAVAACTDVMAAHYPNRLDAPNRLPDHLIEL